MEMYDGVKTAVMLDDGQSECFDVIVVVHHRSVSSPLLYAVVLDKTTKNF